MNSLRPPFLSTDACLHVVGTDSPEISPLMRQLLAYLIEAPDGRLYQKDWEKLVEESIHALIKVSRHLALSFLSGSRVITYHDCPIQPLLLCLLDAPPFQHVPPSLRCPPRCWSSAGNCWMPRWRISRGTGDHPSAPPGP